MADGYDTTTPGKSPAFQFYPTDFLSDPNVIGMTLPERGAYITLLCLCWQNSLPSDVGRLARLCGVPASAFARLWPALEPCFRVDPEDGSKLIHPRLERERAKQREWKAKSAVGGRKSQAKRHHAPTTVEPPLQPNTDTSSPSSSLSSSSDFSQKNTARVSEFPERARATTKETTLALRAGDFLERYRALHVRLRHARYVGKEHLDFQEALTLVGVYDDDGMLDKLAYTWLNTNHDFAESGTRTVAKFRSMASWCEEQVHAWEAKNGKPFEVAS